jgi:hypothetical protein
MGWRAGQKSLLLSVAGEFFPLTLPVIERANRQKWQHSLSVSQLSQEFHQRCVVAPSLLRAPSTSKVRFGDTLFLAAALGLLANV